MKATKRISAIFLALVLVLSLLPVSVFAAGSDYSTRLLVDKVADNKVDVKWMVQTSNGAVLKTTNSIIFKYDHTKYDMLTNDGTVITPKGMSENLFSHYKANYKQNVTVLDTPDLWNTSGIYAEEKGAWTFVSILVQTAYNTESKSYPDETSLAVIHLQLKSGTVDDGLPGGSIALATATEADGCAQSGIVIFFGEGEEQFIYGRPDGSANTLLTTPVVAPGTGVTFTKSAYPGDIAAPTVNSNAGGKVVLNDAVLNPADSAAKIKYGYSTSASTAPTTWQDSTTFTGLTPGSTYYFYAKVEGTSSYAEKVSAATSVTVADKAAPTITTLPTASVTYGDAVADSALTGGVASPGGTFHWMSGVTDYGDAGTKTLKAKFVPTDTAAYATVENIDVAVTVSAKALTDVAVEDIAAQAYTGSQITPAVEVKGDGGKKLVKDKDYTVDYGANNTTGTGAGTVTVKAKTDGNYTFGNVVKHFDINAGSADDTLKGKLKATHTPYTGTYNGTAHNAFTADMSSVTGWTATYSRTETGTYGSMPTVENVADSGNIYVKFSHASYADVIAEYEVKITQKSISDMLVTLDHDSFVYDGTDKTVAVTSVKTTDGAVTLTPTSDYTIDSGSSTMTAKNVPEGAGYPVVVAGTGNYTGTHTVYWKITKADPNAADFDILGSSAPLDYTGDPISVTPPTLKSGKTDAGAVTVYYKGASGTTYSKDTNPPTEVGTYDVTFDVAGGKNFNAASDLIYGTLTIQAKDVSETRTAEDQTVVKGIGDFTQPTFGALTGTLTYTYGSGTKTYEEIKADLAGKAANDTATIGYSYAADGNYAGTITGTINVTVVDVVFEVSGVTATVGNTLTFKANPTYGDDWSKIVKIKDGVTITAKVGTNTDTDQSHFTLKQTGKPGAGSQAYTLSYNGTINGVTYSDVTVVSGNVDVAQKAVTVSGITASSKVYDGKTNATVNAPTATFAGMVAGDNLTITPTGAFTDANVGENKTVTLTLGALSGTSAANYTLDTANSQTEAKADITAKDVTISGITATNRSYEKDNLSVALTNGTVVGAVTGEDVTVDLTNAKGTMADANAGTGKAVTVTGVALGGTAKDNYNLTAQPSGVTVDITQATYGNKTANGSAKYGASGTVDLSGLIVAGGTAIYTSHTDANNVLNGTPAMAADGKTLDFTFKDDATNAAKTADIVVGVTSANYLPYDITVTVTVNNKLTPAVNAPTAIAGLEYNGSEQLLIAAGSTTGGTMQYSLTPGGGYGTELPKAENAGTYTVYYKVIGNDDYADVAENYISVSVAKRTISVKADNKSMTVNGTLPAFTVSYGNFASGDSEADVIETKATASCTADGTSTGSFPITVSGTTTLKSGMDTNYQVGTPESGTLTVNSAYSGGGSYTPSYSITVDKTENGTITVSPKSASKGDTVTITVKPDKGYELEMLKALDKDGDALKLTEKNGKYTFKMPSGKVTVKGSFVEEAPVQIFKDVPVDAYYYEAVKWAAEKGITGGVGNGLFGPNDPCTRAQIVTFLWRAAGSPAPKHMSSFADVPADAFYAKAVAWAVENGITGGTGDGKFSPDATCTRAQSVTFLYRAAGSPKVSSSAEFGDVATNAYYADAVAWAAKNGITGGIGGGLFGSGNDCTRAQIVTFLYRSVK